MGGGGEACMSAETVSQRDFGHSACWDLAVPRLENLDKVIIS